QGHIYPLAAHRLYLIPAGVHFGYRCLQDTLQFFVHFDVLGLLRISLLELFDRVICLPELLGLEALVVDIEQDLESGQYNSLELQCRLKAVIFQALAQYIKNAEPDKIKRSSRLTIALEPIIPAIHYIEKNIFSKLSNREL